LTSIFPLGPPNCSPRCPKSNIAAIKVASPQVKMVSSLPTFPVYVAQQFFLADHKFHPVFAIVDPKTRTFQEFVTTDGPKGVTLYLYPKNHRIGRADRLAP
jgi:hypothetical protein